MYRTNKPSIVTEILLLAGHNLFKRAKSEPAGKGKYSNFAIGSANSFEKEKLPFVCEKERERETNVGVFSN
jgi:hypothetical protein